MESLIESVSQLIDNQGIANVISLALLYIIFNMQRGQKAETKQQDRLITQSGLNQTITQGIVEEIRKSREEQRQSTVEIIDLKKLMARLIDVQTVGDNDRRLILDTGKQTIASIDKNTEGVNSMKDELDRVLLELAVMSRDIRSLIDSVNTATQELRASVINKTTEYEQRLEGLEATVKQLKPIIEQPPKPVNDEPIEVKNATIVVKGILDNLEKGETSK